MSKRSKVACRTLAGVAAALGALAGPLGAQTDYYNTDKGRPVRIEDAAPVERHAFELQLAPLRLERESGGVYHWEVAPELAYGILPRTQLEVGFPISLVDAADDGGASGLAGIEVAALHSLNVETRTLPALAVAAEVLLPTGGLAPDGVYTSLKGIATRTFTWARFHANAQYTFGDDVGEGEDAGDESRWMAGLAVDRTFPLRSLLVIADVFAEQPLHDGEELAWTAETGLRYQTSPQFNVDLGVGRRFAGGDQGWFFTFGASHAFAVRSLMPSGR
ncbi:MAG TPA: hypothetical protein VK399_00685 [Longimicrobiaceae bacterium]|jgi:hypothetical protein|nr:hypothetical protein [Longimicrobiaceae bacterium]